ncbi:MAG: amidohydrolase [Candidatus Rokubacteria bacterium]|nr:amidohydrolase [Candidatus Rokubacteria bacterium]
MRDHAIDVHAHFFPEPYLKVIEVEGASFGASVDRANPKGPSLRTAAGTTPPLDPTYFDVDRRVRAMDKAGVQVHALSLTSPMVYWAGPDLGARLARAYNDACAQAHRAYPTRFVGCATLPLQDAARALEELERAATLPGIRGVYMGTNVNGRDLSDPALFPIFQRCEALRLPVLLHPITVIGGEHRLRPFYLNNLLGNPFDNAIAAAHFIFGGILDRCPKLDVVLPHGGGAFPYLWGRLQRGQKVRPEAKTAAKKPVASYLRRFHYDTITHDPGALTYLVNTVGADRVSLGSDYCFDMGYDRPRAVIERGLRLPPADREKILRGNAARLLRLR